MNSCVSVKSYFDESGDKMIWNGIGGDYVIGNDKDDRKVKVVRVFFLIINTVSEDGNTKK